MPNTHRILLARDVSKDATPNDRDCRKFRTMKSLDAKLASIHADPSGSKAFILADAKDADMAFGMGAPGQSPEGHAGEVRFRTLAEYRDQIRQIVRQGLVDIMLMSASTNAQLAIAERIFDGTLVSPAARANDTSDVFVVRGGKYLEHPSQPFRTATLDHIQCGHVDCAPAERTSGANLGLYSLTFTNRLDDDLAALNAYREFRIEAERKGFRHFLEVFDPNVATGMDQLALGKFVNDHIARTLAGVAPAGRPVFLKIVYHGPKAMEELVAYDPHLVVGILGGGAGTTYDAFKLLAEAKKYGARAALFGRKINSAECQLAFVEFLRLIAENAISPEEAVRAYHGVLAGLKIKPLRTLADDLTLQTGVMSYGGGSSASIPTAIPPAVATPALSATQTSTAIAPSTTQTPQPTEKKHSCSCGCNGKKANGCAPSDSRKLVYDPNVTPDFSAMTQREKLAYNQSKRDHLFGRYTN